MKKNKLLFALLMLWVMQSHATQWSVSNSVQNPGQFNSLTAAVASSSVISGDTLLLHPTNTNYGNVTLTKRVVMIGAGFNTQRTAAQYAAVTQIDLGSATQAGGSKFYGLRMSQIVANVGFSIPNINVEDCYITNNILLSATPVNWTVRNCVFTANSNYNIDLQQSTSNSGSMLISHCLFTNTITLSQSTLIIRNCVFVQGSFGGIQNATFENCIFRSTSIAVGGVTNSVFNNCISALSTLPTSGNSGSGNLPPASVTFVNSPSNSVNLAHDYHLTTTSVGYTDGNDGQQLGVFGGNSTFSIYGEPLNSAIIRNFNITNSVIPVNGTLNINATITKPNGF